MRTKILEALAFLRYPWFTVGALVVVHNGGEILLVERRKVWPGDAWNLPGGFIVRSETVAGAAQRQLHSLGISVNEWELAPETSFRQLNRRHVDIVFSIAIDDAVRADMPVVSSGRKHRWVRPRELKQDELSVAIRHITRTAPRVLHEPPSPYQSSPSSAVVKSPGAQLRDWMPALAIALSLASILAYALSSRTLESCLLSLLVPQVIAASIAGAYAVLSYRSYTKQSIDPNKRPQVFAFSEFDSKIADHRVSLTASDVLCSYRLLVSPQANLARVYQNVKKNVRSVSLETKYVFRQVERLRAASYIPLELLPKYELQDNLQVVVNGRETPVCTRADFLVHASAVIESLLEAAGVVLARDLRKAVFENLMGALSPANAEMLRLQLQDRLTSLETTTAGRARQYVRMAMNLSRLLSETYPLCIDSNDVTVDGELVASVRRRVYTGRPRVSPGQFKRMRDAARASFNIDTGPISVPLGNADRCRSFHLEIEGPEGMFLGRQFVSDLSGEPVRVDPHVRYSLRPRLGQRHAHFYVISGKKLTNKYYTAVFYERLPGSVVVSALSSLAGTSIIFLMATLRLTSHDVGEQPGDLILLAATVPAVISAWAGFTLQGNGTLIARVTTGLTITFTTVAAFTYALTSSRDYLRSEPISHRAHFQVWLIVFALSVINSVVSGGTAVLRTWVLHRFLSRRTDTVQE